MSTVRLPTSSKRPDVPSASDVIPLAIPQLGGNEWTYLRECLDTGWVSSAGPFVERFEREMAAYVGATHAVAMVNGTAALHMALQVVGVSPGDEVLVPDLTFIAPVNAIHYCQAHPVLIDADPATWQMDAEQVARFLAEECELRTDVCYDRRTGRRVQAMLPVHLLGLACEMDQIGKLATQYHLRVVEDAAEAVGVRYHGRHVGTFGDVGVLSFNGNKIMTTGGGGMLLTDQLELAQRARYLSTQAKDDEAEYVHHEIGYNYRLTNLQAALGVAQLEQLDGFIARKRAVARAYESLLQHAPEITVMPHPREVEPTYWLYTVLLPEGMGLARRQGVIRQLQERGVSARALWHPIHGLPPYRDSRRSDVRNATALYERAISLPSSVGLRPEEVARSVTALLDAMAEV